MLLTETDVAGSDDLTRTLVVPSTYDPTDTALHVRLKAAVSTVQPKVTCESSNVDVMGHVSVSIASSGGSSHGNRNAIMTGKLNLPAPAQVT